MPQEIIDRLVLAVTCAMALDLPNDEAVEVLEKAGWSYADRFEISSSEFVKTKQLEAVQAYASHTL